MGICANTDIHRAIRNGNYIPRCIPNGVGRSKACLVLWVGSLVTRRTEPQAGAAGAADGRAQVVQAMP